MLKYDNNARNLYDTINRRLHNGKWNKILVLLLLLIVQFLLQRLNLYLGSLMNYFIQICPRGEKDINGINECRKVLKKLIGNEVQRNYSDIIRMEESVRVSHGFVVEKAII